MPRLRAGLERRFRSKELWAVYLVIYGAIAGYAVWDSFRIPGWSAHPEVWAINVLSPWGWLGGMFWLSPIPWQWRRVSGRLLTLRAVLRAAILSEVWIAGLSWIDLHLYHHAGIPVPAGQILPFNLLVTAPVTALAGYMISRFEDSDRAREEALVLAKEAQSKLLQSQMHPHVLFNSLNGLAELIVKDPPAAEDSVRALSDLLRRLLAAAESPLIALSEERAMVEAYLALESLRLGPRMVTRWEWDGGLQDLRIPPLTLQPLVENAIKHGVSPSKEGGTLALILRREGACLMLAVKNTGQEAPRSSTPGFGMGLRNLRERLVLAYGARVSLALDREGAWTVAQVRIRDFIMQP